MLARAFALALIQGHVLPTYRTEMQGRIEHEPVLQKFTRLEPARARTRIFMPDPRAIVQGASSCRGESHRLRQQYARFRAGIAHLLKADERFRHLVLAMTANQLVDLPEQRGILVTVDHAVAHQARGQAVHHGLAHCAQRR
jgi:hypothetical protein